MELWLSIIFFNTTVTQQERLKASTCQVSHVPDEGTLQTIPRSPIASRSRHSWSHRVAFTRGNYASMLQYYAARSCWRLLKLVPAVPAK